MSLSGIVPVEAVVFACGTHDWAFARDEAARIDAHWRQRRARQPALFDGRIFLARSVALDADGRHLRATAFETDYRNFLAWRDFGFPGEGVFNLFSMGALQSADGAFLMGEMGAATACAGMLYFAAGTPDPSDARGGFVDLEANVVRELREETGFATGGLAMDSGWRVVFDGSRIACMKRLRSPLSAGDLITRFQAFQAAERDPELAALVPVRSPDDIDEARMPGFMVMFLRDAFGLGDTPGV